MQGFDFIVLETANVHQVTVITSVVRVGGLSKGGDHIRKQAGTELQRPEILDESINQYQRLIDCRPRFWPNQRCL
jgi:hypothetical protein